MTFVMCTTYLQCSVITTRTWLRWSGKSLSFVFKLWIKCFKTNNIYLIFFHLLLLKVVVRVCVLCVVCICAYIEMGFYIVLSLLLQPKLLKPKLLKLKRFQSFTNVHDSKRPSQHFEYFSKYRLHSISHFLSPRRCFSSEVKFQHPFDSISNILFVFLFSF